MKDEHLKDIGIALLFTAAAVFGVWLSYNYPPPEKVYKDGYLIKIIDGHEYIYNSDVFSSQLIHSESCPNPTHKEVTK